MRHFQNIMFLAIKNSFFLVLIFSCFSFCSFSATITSAGTGNWSATGTWVGGVVPGAGDAVVIGATHVVTVNNNFSCTSLTLTTPTSNNKVTFSGAFTLTVSGAVTTNVTASTTSSTIEVLTGTLIAGSMSLTGGSSSSKFSYLTVSTGTITCSGNMVSSGSLSTFAFTGAGTFNIGGSFSTGAFTPNSGTVNFNGSSAQTIPNYTYNILKSNNTAGATLSAACTITTLTIGDVSANSVFSDGGFVITPGASSVLNLTSGTYSLGSIGTGTSWPAWTTRNIATGTTVEYSSGTSQTVSSTPSYKILKISGAGTKTAGGNLTIAEDLNVSAGVLDLLTFTANRTSLGGTITIANLATLKIGGTNTFPSNYTTRTLGSTSTVDYSGTAQTVANEAYGNLTLSTSGVKTMPGSALVVAGTLTMSGTVSATLLNTLSIGALTQTAGTLTDGGFTITVTGTGGTVWTKSGTFTATGLVNFTGASPTINGSNFNNLQFSGSGTLSVGTVTVAVAGTFVVSSGNVDIAGTTITVTGATTVSGTLTHSSASGTKIYTGLVTVNGTWNNSGNSAITFRGGLTNLGTFTSGTGTYTFDTNSQSISGTLTIGTVTIPTAIVVLNNNTLTVSTALSGAGTLRQAASSYLYITGASGITTLDATTNTPNTVDYNGGNQTIHTNNYSNLTVSASGVKIMAASAAINVAGILTMTNGIIDAITNASVVFTVSNTATTAVTGGSTTSYIKGALTWTIPASLASGSTYVYPMGAAAYLPFSLVNPTTSTGVITVKIQAFSSNPAGSFDASLVSKSTTEYWSLVSTGNFTNSGVAIGRPSGITENVIARATTVAGVYSSNCGDISGTNLINSATSSGASQFFQLAKKINVVTSPSVTESSLRSMTISWTAAAGYLSGANSTLVFVKATSAVSQGTPTNVVSTYTASTTFGSGTAFQNDASAYCVYKGDGTTVSVTGLTSGVTYHILIYTVIDAIDGTCNKYFYSSGVTSSIAIHTPTNYYVDNNSNAGDMYTSASAIGSDAAAGTSLAPFATLTHALLVVKPGDNIYVDAGTWSYSGTYSNPHNFVVSTSDISIIGAGMRVTNFDDQMGSNQNYWLKIAANNITIKNLTVTQFNNTGDAHALYIGDGTNTYSGIKINTVEIYNNGSSAGNTGSKAVIVMSKTTSVFTNGGSDCNQPAAYAGCVWVNGTNIDVTFNYYSFVGNTGDGFGGSDGGGLVISGGNSSQIVKLNHCLFQDNKQTHDDFNAMDIKMSSGDLRVEHCIFANSQARMSAGTAIGGSIEISGGTASFNRSRFTGHSSSTGNLKGAAIGNLGGIITIDSCYFSGNTATGANDLHNENGTMTVTNCVLTEVEGVTGTFTIDKSGNPTSSGLVTKTNTGTTPTLTAPTTPSYMGGCSLVAFVVLPIELTSFTAEKQKDNSVNVNWSTLTEKNNDYFIIKKSMDGIEWNEIARENGAGTSFSQNDYLINDNSEMAEIVYYQLSQVDFDGKRITFDPVSVRFTNQVGQFYYVNMMGQMVDFKNCPSGIYLKVFDNGFTEKVFK